MSKISGELVQTQQQLARLSTICVFQRIASEILQLPSWRFNLSFLTTPRVLRIQQTSNQVHCGHQK